MAILKPWHGWLTVAGQHAPQELALLGRGAEGGDRVARQRVHGHAVRDGQPAGRQGLDRFQVAGEGPAAASKLGG
jgi:hypothetical protein